MTKRRLLFATPFVLVVGCKAPAPASPHEDEQTSEEESPVVVAIPEAIDAPVADAPDLHLEAAAGIRHLVPPPEYSPDAAVDPPQDPRKDRICCVNPPSAYYVRIIGMQVRSDGTELIIGAGEDKGFTPKAVIVRVVDSDHEPVKRGDVTLRSCDRRTCRGTVTLSPDEVKMRSSEVEVRFK